MIFCVGAGTYWPAPRKYDSDQFSTSGSQASASTLLIAVSVMLSATSPWAR